MALLLSIGLLAGCAPTPDHESAGSSQEPLRICSLKGPTTIGLASLIAENGLAQEAEDGAAADAAEGDAAPGNADAPYLFEMAAM